MKTQLAILSGKLTATLVRTLRLGSGTSLPGKVALRLDRDLLARLGHQVRSRRIAVTGTNGKSTTAGLLSAFLEAAGERVVHNQLGANMVPGITAALLLKSSIWGHLAADSAVIEADEASLPAVATALKPDLTVVTNLFRDQLDRYGELDTTARLIRRGIEIGGGRMALNADDPMVASLGAAFPADRVLYYGVHAVEYPAPVDLDFPVGFPREVTDCPLCQATLHYHHMIYGHLGQYHCTGCGFQRPTPHVEATMIRVETAASHIQLRHGKTVLPEITLALPGLFNAYNFLAAATAGLWANCTAGQLTQAVSHYRSLFGRAEKRLIEGKPAMIFLIKNPVGAMEVLKAVSTDPDRQVLIVINDNDADGRDISWLWDAPFELLARGTESVWVAGQRAADMALRLRYAGVPEDRIRVADDPFQALHQAAAETGPAQTLYVLPTYTALLDLSHALGSR